MAWPSSVACVETQLGLEGQGGRVRGLIECALYASDAIDCNQHPEHQSDLNLVDATFERLDGD
jgi:hypothetical protein